MASFADPPHEANFQSSLFAEKKPGKKLYFCLMEAKQGD
jgi:hypothetical protein